MKKILYLIPVFLLLTISSVTAQQCMDSTHCDLGDMCGPGYICTPNICSSPSDCAWDLPLCVAGTCIPKCQSDADCGDYLCDDGTCIPKCQSDADCGDGFCYVGRCATCTETDTGNEPYLEGTVTSTVVGSGTDIAEDDCKLEYPDGSKIPVLSCDSPSKCFVLEFYCNLGLRQFEYIRAPPETNCYNGAFICSLDTNCPTGYICDDGTCIEGVPIVCSTINCADYNNDETGCRATDPCCNWDPVSYEIPVCVNSNPDALYCSLNGIIREGLEDCDCGILGQDEECTPEQLGGITTCTEYSSTYLSGTLSCTDRCEYDTSRCSTQPGAAEEITECSQYPFLIDCKTDEFHLECYINDFPETPICESCSLIGKCSLYQTLDSCIDNFCNVDPDCDWVGDTESGYCDFVNTFTNDQGETVDCTGVDWGPCEDGVRRTTGTCILSDESQEVQEVSCRVTKKFPFFSKSGIIIILILLIGYYLYTNLEKKKK